MMLFLLVLFSCCSKAISVISVEELTQGISKFSSDIYQQCAQSKNGNGNMIISPYSLWRALAFLSQGTNGVTFDELRKGLYLNSNKSIVVDQYHELDQLIHKSANDSELSIANKIYLKNEYELKKDFVEMAVNKFSSGIESVDFGRRNETAEKINRFVEDKTRQPIKNGVVPQILNEYTRFILINTINLKYKWRHKLMKVGAEFYFNETDFVRVDALRRKAYQFNVGIDLKDLDAHSLELGYLNSNFIFLIILPKKRTGLLELEDRLKDYDLTKVFDQMSIQEINFKIPKFKVETEVNFNEILKNLGITTMFNESRADLSGMVNTREGIFINHVVQKAYIQVDEDGSEAAPRRRAIGHKLVKRERFNFNAEHPFMYFVWDKLNKIPILSGHIKKL